MVKPLNIYEAKSRLSELVERVETGEEITIARAGEPVARLVPLKVAERKPGAWAGKVIIAEDFDAPLPNDIVAGFYGDDAEDAE
jgi:prevent-host-death family protein